MMAHCDKMASLAYIGQKKSERFPELKAKGPLLRQALDFFLLAFRGQTLAPIKHHTCNNCLFLVSLDI